MGGGGGNDDFVRQQQAAEDKKQKARDALNAAFGIASGSTGSPLAAPDRAQFVRPASPGTQIGMPDENGAPRYDGAPRYANPTPESFDQAGYDAALQAYNDSKTTVDANKASRDALYDTVRTNAFDGGMRRLNESKDQAGRALKFELFAKGLNGGSTDVDQNALLGRTFSQGVLDLGGKADAIKAGMRGSDESTRLGLLQSIDAGLDQGSALSSALNQMQVNNDRAMADSTGASVGDVFSTAGLLYGDSQARKGQGSARSQYPWLFSATAAPGGSGRSSSGGIITSTGGQR